LVHWRPGFDVLARAARYRSEHLVGLGPQGKHDSAPVGENADQTRVWFTPSNQSNCRTFNEIISRNLEKILTPIRTAR
jgi:hypothetical protein